MSGKTTTPAVSSSPSAPAGPSWTQSIAAAAVSGFLAAVISIFSMRHQIEGQNAQTEKQIENEKFMLSQRMDFDRKQFSEQLESQQAQLKRQLDLQRDLLSAQIAAQKQRQVWEQQNKRFDDKRNLETEMTKAFLEFHFSRDALSRDLMWIRFNEEFPIEGSAEAMAKCVSDYNLAREKVLASFRALCGHLDQALLLFGPSVDQAIKNYSREIYGKSINFDPVVAIVEEQKKKKKGREASFLAIKDAMGKMFSDDPTTNLRHTVMSELQKETNSDLVALQSNEKEPSN